MSKSESTCKFCASGLVASSNAKDPEYYSQYYTNPYVPRPIKYYIYPCSCECGKLISGYYKIPKTEIYSYEVKFRNDGLKFYVRFTPTGGLVDLVLVLQEWIKSGNLDRFSNK
jgi:hypothetical protein